MTSNLRLGMLDRSFGAGGGAFIPVEDTRACAVAVDARGQVVIAGNLVGGAHSGNHDGDHIVLARLTREGALDCSFGSGGILGLPAYAGCRCSGSILLDPAGHIFLTATSGGPAPASWLVCVDPQGRVVGAGRDPVGAHEESVAGRSLTLSVLAASGDGSLLAAGTAGSSRNQGRDFALARLDLHGELDPSFGHRGVATTDFAGRRFEVSCLLVDAGSGFLVLGSLSDDRSAHPAILRYLPDGQLDTGFGSGGVSVGDFGGAQDRALTGVLYPSGRILIAGSSRSSRGERPVFAAYRPDGRLDADFALQGHGPQEAPELGGAFTSAALDTTGQAVLAGRLTRGQVTGVGLTRLTERGRLDPASGVGGVLLTQLRGRGGAVGLATDPSGEIVVAAETESADGLIALRHVIPNGLPVAGSVPPAGVPYLSRADLEARQRELMMRIQHDHDMATMINRGI